MGVEVGNQKVDAVVVNYLFHLAIRYLTSCYSKSVFASVRYLFLVCKMFTIVTKLCRN